MKLFSRLFAKPPPPPPPSPAERVASLQAAPAEVVETTALGSGDVSLRVGAIGLLPAGDALRMLAGLADPPPGVAASTPPAVRRAAHERLAQLVDAGSIDFDALCSRPDGLSESIAIAALCKDPDRLGRVLAGIDDPVALAKLVTDGTSSRVRQLAAAAIDDPAQLHDLLPRVRGKDKSVYKLIKQKCDALAAAERKAEEYAREVADLCASLERHSTKAHDAMYPATLEALSARWRALAARPDAQLEQRGEQALQRCREVIAAHERDVAERAAAHRSARLSARPSSRLAKHASANSRSNGRRPRSAPRPRHTRWPRCQQLAMPKNTPERSCEPRKRRPSARSAA